MTEEDVVHFATFVVIGAVAGGIRGALACVAFIVLARVCGRYL